jgi:hypothetical protein
MTASNAYRYSDKAMAQERLAMKRWLDANGTKTDAKVVPIDRSARKKPLFVAPIESLDDDADVAPPASRAMTRTPRPGVPAMDDDLWEVTTALTGLGETLEYIASRAADKFERMQASFDNQIAALKNENQALRQILENLRITQRGERGVDGDRGPPGRDGRDGVGQIGPRGEPGPPGKAAPTIAAWATDDDAFSATPILSDGSNGAVLRLRGMFEAYNEQVDASDASAQADADRARRDQVEQEVARQRLGLPAR